MVALRASAMAKYALVTYSERPDVHDAATGAQAKVFSDDRNGRVFSFRGTDDFKDVFCNMSVSRVCVSAEPNTGLLPCGKNWRCSLALCNHIKLHRGFWNQYVALRPWVLEQQQRHPTADAHFTGHSLGGALAQIAALDTALVFPHRLVSCMTFGSPRVGNGAFAVAAEAQMNVMQNERWVHANDPIPHMPLSIRFKHGGIENAIAANECGHSWWWWALKIVLLASGPHTHPHSMRSYSRHFSSRG